MANIPPFSGAGNDLVLPITPADYVNDIEGNFAKCKDEILGLDTRIAAISGITQSAQIALVADVDDQAVNAPLIFAEGDGLGTWKISGFVAKDDFSFEILNVGADDIVIGHQDAGSAVANRIFIDQGADYYLPPGSKVRLTYDKYDIGWRLSVAGIVQKMTKTILVAEFIALGAVTTGNIDFTRSLPPLAMPLAFRALNIVAFASSGGAVTGLAAVLSDSAAVAIMSGSIPSLHLASNRGQKPVDGVTAAAGYPFDVGYTPSGQFTIAGGGVNFGNVTDGEIVMELAYMFQP